MPYVVRRPRLSRIVPVAAAVVASAFATAGPAAAATPDVCVTPSFSQAFLPWHDRALYTKSPGGDFEGAQRGWTFGSGAGVVAGNEAFHIGGADDGSSLYLAPGASAVSSPMCVDRAYPSFRFFARNLTGGKGQLQVEVNWQESGVRRTSRATLNTPPTTAWTPVVSLRLPTGALSTGELEPVTFRFTATGGSYQIDDVYVDPFMRR
jgi:hypothetical protein